MEYFSETICIGQYKKLELVKHNLIGFQGNISQRKYGLDDAKSSNLLSYREKSWEFLQ